MRAKKTSIALVVIAVVIGVYWFSRPAPPPPRGSGEFMKAAVYHEYGAPDVVRIESVEKLLPNDNQVLIKVRAAAANPLDWHVTRGTPYLLRLDNGFRKPKSIRLGADVAGEVVAVGKDVTQFKPGDEVFGGAGGAFAEYARASQSKIALKPASITFEEAAAVPVAALTALQGLRDNGRVKPGQKVLINGASGGVGTYAVQLAKSFGAEVTGICSTRNLELVRGLGADHVIDYTKEDFTQSAQRYDVILDNVGNRSLSEFRRVMKPEAIYVGIGGGGPDAGNWIGALALPIKTFFYSPFVSQEFGFFIAEHNTKDLTFLAQMLDSRKLTSVIDRSYPLSETSDAIRYMESGRARGKVVITVAPQLKPPS